MREWGMLRAPQNNIRVPVAGLAGQDQAAAQLGGAVRDLVQAGSSLAEERRKVEQVADEARLAAKLQQLCRETSEAMADEEPRDWAYAWNRASAPGIAEALAELPEEQRAAGRAMADWLNARASLESQRDHELNRIELSRRSWQRQLDDAVASGDEQRAQHWLSAGQRVFVPEAEMEQKSAEVASRCSLVRWRSRFDENPTQALQSLRASEEELLPTGEPERQRLQELAEESRRRLRREAVVRMADDLRAGRALDAEGLRPWHEAGLLSDEQFAAVQQEVHPQSPEAFSSWLRRVDECGDDEEQRTELGLSIATAPMPPEERTELLERLSEGGGLCASDRAGLSRRLFDWFGRGYFGCASDEPAQRFYLRLQREGFRLLHDEGSEAVASWLESRREAAGRWVCFEQKENRV